jgi:hypothetical protein
LRNTSVSVACLQMTLSNWITLEKPTLSPSPVFFSSSGTVVDLPGEDFIMLHIHLPCDLLDIRPGHSFIDNGLSTRFVTHVPQRRDD